MNIVILKGRLTADPRVSGDGDKKVARYNIACDRVKEGTDYVPCACFGRGADFAEKYLHKGTAIAVEGKITTGSYEKDGKKVYTNEVTVWKHEFCEKRQDNQNPNGGNAPDFMDIPEGIEGDLPFGR